MTSVLRPYEETYADEVIDYVTPNTLVDMSKSLILNPEDHPDLELDTKRISLSFDEVVMVNRFGELVGVDSSTQNSRYRLAKNRMTQQEKLWGFLRQQAQETEQGGIAALLGNGGEEGGEEAAMMQGAPGMMGMGSGRGRRKSSVKRGGNMSGMMQMMMQQMGGEGGAGNF